MAGHEEEAAGDGFAKVPSVGCGDRHERGGGKQGTKVGCRAGILKRAIMVRWWQDGAWLGGFLGTFFAGWGRGGTLFLGL